MGSLLNIEAVVKSHCLRSEMTKNDSTKPVACSAVPTNVIFVPLLTEMFRVIHRLVFTIAHGTPMSETYCSTSLCIPREDVSALAGES